MASALVVEFGQGARVLARWVVGVVVVAGIAAGVDNSGPLVPGDDEWLTVAARDNAPTNPLMTGDSDVKTLILRVSGGDLNAFQAGRLTVEQIRSRAQIGEF